jgi:OOP family OmpA-OmpF porin
MPSLLKHAVVVSAIAAAFATDAVHAQSYVIAGGQPVRSASGECWRTGDWTLEAASHECDPQIAMRPAALEVPAPKPAFTAVSYSAQVLFAFDDDALSADARKQLDGLAQKLLSVEIDKVVAVGHSDAVGAEQYNKRLSARRAKAVGDYLAGKGVSAERLQLVAMGDHDSITAGTCDSLAAESRPDANLISCLQPDRRVKVELVGRQKETMK